MSELRERRFPNREVVRHNKIRLEVSSFVRGVEGAPLRVGEERALSEGLLVVV